MLFNEISANCSIDEYIDVDNTLATSEEVEVTKLTGVKHYDKSVLKN